MPRIELTPPNWDGSKEQARGDGAPTVDLCAGCASMYGEGDEIGPNEFIGTQYNGHTVTCMECEHPPFEDENYHCNACGATLFREDN